MTTRDYIKQKAKREALAEKQFNAKITRALMQSLDLILAEVDKDLINLPQRMELLINRTPVEKVIKELYVKWGFDQFKWFKKSIPFGKKASDDFWLAELERIFKVTGAQKVTEILGTTLELAKPAIQNAIQLAAEGRSIDYIQREIRRQLVDVGGAVSAGRARMIARTEVVSASNNASYTAVQDAQSSGLVVEKRWVTGGVNIRPTHKAAEAQGWIKFEDKFKVGNADMDFPGDPKVKGHPEEIINCKCVLVYRTI